jgi:uncharacterized protein YndB with AHSA1/START domain
MGNINNKTDDLTITRDFNVPRELVWKAWTVPDLLMKWWGPKEFTCPFCKIDIKVGGKYLACMHWVQKDKDFWSTGVYKEIIEHRRLVFTDSFADKEGAVVPATYYGMSSDFPMEMLVTITLDELTGGKTKFMLKHKGIPTGKDLENCKVGWSQTLDKLADFLNNANFEKRVK